MQGMRAQSSATFQIQKLFRGLLKRRRLSSIANSGSISTVSAVISKMSFILNPYDANLDLGNKDNQKLFVDATRGLPKGQKFDGKKESFLVYIKLIGHLLGDLRVEEILN
eukprot:6097905-Ditylum_brightwellii.AAC.1